MGHRPPSPPRAARPTTYLDVLKRDYIRGRITVEQFEREVGLLLSCGKADEWCPPLPPPGRRAA